MYDEDWHPDAPTISTVSLRHDISCGHRIFNHPGKCARIHGHNYRIEFSVKGRVDPVTGMVIDFGILKAQLGEWVDVAWDHRLLLWDKDDLWQTVGADVLLAAGAVNVPFNPTAEGMANYLLDTVGPMVLSNATLSRVRVQETPKCSAEASA